MKTHILAMGLALTIGASASAQTYYYPTTQVITPAYPSNWGGGPPIGVPFAPQPTYLVPQPVQRPTVSTRGYATPQYTTQTYSTQVYTQPAPQQVQSFSGPPQSRCIVAWLNGNQWGTHCASLKLHAADLGYLREKFSHYQPNSGYTLNLPSDDQFR